MRNVSQTTGELQAHIRETRADLNENLKELGQKFKSATDWRQYYEKSPGVFLAVALGAGMVLARSRRYQHEISGVPEGSSEVNESLDSIKSALIGVAATHVKNWLSELLPGDAEQLPEKDKPNAQEAAPTLSLASKPGPASRDTREWEPSENGANRPVRL